MKDLRDKVAVITGAGAGIGLAVARKLASEGCHLALSDINEENLVKAQQELQAMGVRVYADTLDVSDREAFEAYPAIVLRELGQVNIVINNAGFGIAGTVDDLQIEDYEKTMNVHFWGVVYGSKFFLPALRQAEEGHIVNLSSAAGLVSGPGMSAYSAAKFAIRGFTESLRHELANSNIGVSCVHPGTVKTDIIKNMVEGKLYTEDPYGDGSQPFSKSADELHKQFTRLAFTSAEKAADIIVSGIKKRRERILIGPDAKVLDKLQRLFPQHYGRGISIMKKLLTGKSGRTLSVKLD